MMLTKELYFCSECGVYYLEIAKDVFRQALLDEIDDNNCQKMYECIDHEKSE